ncbi:Uu.00g144730.m01.CDS01 [Anthostomella pinea]|uniref:Uu.00g144730.m01.CDS01 n=1 Tax=Anthostomella pinea TaxID=933095 RepID=A0AAI8VS30_9PEZI|nr:Uu.00g144730.m01.CDS01 [Anthostomella pinea]
MLGTHRDNAQFARARWRKTILLPCWIVQLGLLMSIMGLFIFRLSRTVRTWEKEKEKGNVPTVEFVWESVNIGFSLSSLIITLVSIARFIAEVLTPLPLLFMSIISLTLSSAVLALDIVVYVQYADREYSLIGLGMDCALMLFTIIPTIYSILIYRRLLTYDDYHLPGNAKPYGFANANAVDEDTTRYSSSYLQPPTPYDPTDFSTNTNAVTRPRSLSAGRRISLNFSRSNTTSTSPLPSPTPTTTPQPPNPNQTSTTSERRASYDHKRDTQFDEFRARRASANSSTNLQADVQKALGTEFGWDTSNDYFPPQKPQQRQRDSIITTKSVPVSKAQTRARGDSLLRQASWEASLSLTGMGSRSPTPSIIVATPDDTASGAATAASTVMVQPGHSLRSVPETHEEEEDDGHDEDGGDLGAAGSRYGRRSVPMPENEVREALLVRRNSSRASSPASSRNAGGGGGRLGRLEGLEDIELEGRLKRRRDS